MATVERWVLAPSGAGSQDGTSLANAYGSLVDVQTEDPATGADDLIVYCSGGTDDPASNFNLNLTGLTVTIDVTDDTYEIVNSANFFTGMTISGSVDFTGYPLKCRTSAGTSPSSGIFSTGSGISVNFLAGLIIVGNTGLANNASLRCGGGNCTVNNLLIEGGLGAGARTSFNAAAPNLVINFGTIVNCAEQGTLNDSSTMTLNSVYVGGNGGADIAGGAVQNTCAASDTSATDPTLDSIAWDGTNFESTDPADIDVTDIAAPFGAPTPASGLQGAGTDISGVTTDYKGWTRTSPPDIGGVQSLGIASEQEGFRFYDDDGSESAATARQAQDVADSVTKATNVRLRVLTDYTGNPPTAAATLRYKRADEPDTEWRTIN